MTTSCGLRWLEAEPYDGGNARQAFLELLNGEESAPAEGSLAGASAIHATLTGPL